MASAQQSAPHRATGGLNDSPGGFYWVGHEQDRAENAKEKRNFARRSSKAARLQKLKDSIKPFPTGSTTVAHFPRPHTRIAPSIQCGPLDVFPSLSGLTSQNVNTYFYFFKSYTSRTAYPFCASTMTQWHYRIALDQPTLIEILGASGAYSQSWNYARAGYPQHIVEKIGRDALSLKVQAMHSLRTLLNDDRRSTWESTVPIIAQLLFIEVLYTKAKGIHAHLNALKQIANALGGYDNIKNNTLSVFYCAEIVGALANNLSPSFSMASKWENEVKKEFETYLRVNGWPPSSLGSRFFSSPWSKDIPPPLLDTLRSFQHLIAYYESASDIENEDSRIKNNYLIFATRRLFHLPMECPLSPSHETIRLAILAYCSSRIWSTPLSPCVDTIMKALRPALAQSFNKLQNTAPDLLFWILFIFGFSTQNMQYQPWIATHIRQSAKSLKLESWNDALPVLEVFFFVCRSPQDPAISYWTSAISSEPFGVQKQVQNRT